MQWGEVTKSLKGSKNDIKPTFVLMYLAIVKEDHAYHMVEEFEHILNKFKESRGKDQDEKILRVLKTLTHPNSTSEILDQMEEAGLLISRKETDDVLRYRYRLNVNVFRNPEGKMGAYHINKGVKWLQWSIANKQIEVFLEELRKQPKDTYYDNWTKIGLFDFRTFILFLYAQAKELKLAWMANELHIYIHEENSERKDDTIGCPSLSGLRPDVSPKSQNYDNFKAALGNRLKDKVEFQAYLTAADKIDLAVQYLRTKPEHKYLRSSLDIERVIYKAPNYHFGEYPFPELQLIKTTGVDGATIRPDFQSDMVVTLLIDRHTEYDNDLIFDTLFASKDAIEREIGTELEWIKAELGDPQQIRKKIIDGGIIKTQNWEEIQEAMIDVMIKMERAFSPRIKEMKALL